MSIATIFGLCTHPIPLKINRSNSDADGNSAFFAIVVCPRRRNQARSIIRRELPWPATVSANARCSSSRHLSTLLSRARLTIASSSSVRILDISGMGGNTVIVSREIAITLTRRQRWEATIAWRSQAKPSCEHANPELGYEVEGRNRGSGASRLMARPVTART